MYFAPPQVGREGAEHGRERAEPGVGKEGAEPGVGREGAEPVVEREGAEYLLELQEGCEEEDPCN